MVAAEIEEINNTVSPYFSVLEDTSTKDRPAKRRAIDVIKKSYSQVKNASIANGLIANTIHSLLICTESEIEYVRENSVHILKSLIAINDKESIQETTLVTILKISNKRLSQSIEPTEEIRVVWMELVIILLELQSSNIKAEHFMDILQIAVKDPFSEVQKLASNLLCLFTIQYPKMVDYACNRMIEYVMPLLVHKHTAIRSSGIKAMEAVLLTSAKGFHLLFEYNEDLDKRPIIPSLIYDPSALVRQQLFITLGNLLCEWNPRDRYEYGEKILPVILFGAFDELPAVESACQSALTRVADICVHDLYEAEVLKDIPTDASVRKTIGLKHLVHICYDSSLNYLLDKSTDFVVSRQITSLSALKLFLEYAVADDLVRSFKKLMNCLVLVFSSNHTTESDVFEILSIISNQLHSIDIYLDILLPKLDPRYLNDETSNFPAEVVITTVITFLEYLITITEVSSQSTDRIKNALRRPHIENYKNHLSVKTKQSITALNENVVL